jgi:hypothetical protein
MPPRRTVIPELLMLGLSVAVLAMQFPELPVTLHRVAVSSLQTVARVAGTAALKLEASYKVRVAP